jgi:hypothetical protein
LDGVMDLLPASTLERVVEALRRWQAQRGIPVSRAFPSSTWSILTDIYRCRPCSSHEIDHGTKLIMEPGRRWDPPGPTSRLCWSALAWASCARRCRSCGRSSRCARCTTTRAAAWRASTTSHSAKVCAWRCHRSRNRLTKRFGFATTREYREYRESYYTLRCVARRVKSGMWPSSVSSGISLI